MSISKNRKHEKINICLIGIFEYFLQMFCYFKKSKPNILKNKTKQDLLKVYEAAMQPNKKTYLGIQTILKTNFHTIG